MMVLQKTSYETNQDRSLRERERNLPTQGSTAAWEGMVRMMDTAFRIPGTSIRFGLDPLLGLIPGVGDVLTGLISSTLLFRANQMNLPKIVQFRMALNIFLNTIIGAIPGFGDLFSIWFKSNVRNYELLQRYHTANTSEQRRTTTNSWLFVILLFSLTFAVIIGMLALGFAILNKLFS